MKAIVKDVTSEYKNLLPENVRCYEYIATEEDFELPKFDFPVIFKPSAETQREGEIKSWPCIRLVETEYNAIYLTIDVFFSMSLRDLCGSKKELIKNRLNKAGLNGRRVGGDSNVWGTEFNKNGSYTCSNYIVAYHNMDFHWRYRWKMIPLESLEEYYFEKIMIPNSPNLKRVEKVNTGPAKFLADTINKFTNWYFAMYHRITQDNRSLPMYILRKKPEFVEYGLGSEGFSIILTKENLQHPDHNSKWFAINENGLEYICPGREEYMIDIGSTVHGQVVEHIGPNGPIKRLILSDETFYIAEIFKPDIHPRSRAIFLGFSTRSLKSQKMITFSHEEAHENNMRMLYPDI